MTPVYPLLFVLEADIRLQIQKALRKLLTMAKEYIGKQASHHITTSSWELKNTSELKVASQGHSLCGQEPRVQPSPQKLSAQQVIDPTLNVGSRLVSIPPLK